MTTDILNTLADLEGLVAGLRPIPQDFERLADTLEATRDAVRDFLGGLADDRERHAVEFQLLPRVVALLDRMHRAVDKAHQAGVITDQAACDLKMLGLSLNFVTSLSRLPQGVKELAEHLARVY